MQIATAIRQVESHGLGDTAEFKIRMDAHMASLLSDTVYSDKIGAVIRELSCNAFDSHVAAGKPDVPFDVHLPNSMEPWFSITDHGLGLSHEDTMDLYTTYGSSTKRDSNDVIGALGIGSKSFFAYTDSCTITVRHEGRKRFYTAYKDQTGMPTIALMGEQATNDPNGLEIYIPVRDRDIHEFEVKARKIYARFNPVPNVTGVPDFSVSPPEYLFQGNGWALRSGYGKPHAVMGPVAYPIDVHVFPTDEMIGHRRALLEAPIDIEFNMGDVMVAMSRESLSYKGPTIPSILAKVDQVIEEIPTYVEHHFANAKTLWEAKRTYHDVVTNARGLGRVGTLIRAMKLKWKEQAIDTDEIHIDLTNLPGSYIAFVDRRGSTHQTLKLENTNRAYIQANERIQFYVQDDKNRVRAKIQNVHPRGAEAVVIRAANDEHLEKMLEMMGHPPYRKVSELPEPPPNPRAQRARTSVRKVYRLKATYQYESRDAWDEIDHDVTRGGIFVPLHNWTTQGKGTAGQLFQTAKVLGIAPVNLFGIPASHSTIPEKNPGWVDFRDWLRPKFKALLTREEIKQIANWRELRALHKELGRDYTWEHILTPENVLLPKKNRSLAGRFIRQFRAMGPRQIDNLQAYEYLSGMLDVPIKEVKPAYELCTLYEEVSQKYPLLNMVRHYHGEQHVDKFIDYINAID